MLDGNLKKMGDGYRNGLKEELVMKGGLKIM
jgi:hypothetical protein